MIFEFGCSLIKFDLLSTISDGYFPKHTLVILNGNICTYSHSLLGTKS